MAIIKEASQLQDFLGINYYQSNWVKANEADSLIHHNGTGDKGSSIFRLKQIAEIVKNMTFQRLTGIGIFILKVYMI